MQSNAKAIPFRNLAKLGIKLRKFCGKFLIGPVICPQISSIDLKIGHAMTSHMSLITCQTAHVLPRIPPPSPLRPAASRKPHLYTFFFSLKHFRNNHNHLVEKFAQCSDWWLACLLLLPLADPHPHRKGRRPPQRKAWGLAVFPPRASPQWPTA